MFQKLQEKLHGAIRTLTGKGKISEINIAESVKQIRRALVDADVNYKIAKEFTNKVKEKALGEDILIAVEPGQMFVKIVYDELTELMGGVKQPLKFSQEPPTVILMAGLQGSGKTTFSGKLAKLLQEKENKKVLLVAGDVYRPAAIEQISVLAGQIGAEVFKEEDNKDPVDIAKKALKHAKENKFDVVIIDTAGRLSIDEEMMNEIRNIKEAVNPDEILFVVDAMTGQDAVNTAKAFNDVLNFTGVVLTKLDGDTRGGAALSIKAVVKKPIKFVGVGEKLDDIEYFYPDRMASRILGMGDVVSLVEKLQQEFEEKEAKELEKKLRKNKFDFNDFLKQLKLIKKMGGVKKIVGMLPGISSKLGDMEIDEKAFKRVEAIILSMTPKERENPAIINGSRRRRIARGSGTSVEEVNALIKQFQQMRKMIKTLNKWEKKGRKAEFFPMLKGLKKR